MIRKILLITFLILVGSQLSFALINNQLKPGDEGTEVSKIQQFLIGNKFLTVKANGVYGPATTKAVRDYQVFKKIKNTGIVGTLTLASINANLNTNSPLKLNKNVKYKSDVKKTIDKNFTVSGWIPYWRKASGTIEVINNINKIDIVSPFAFEMQSDGTFKDTLKLSESPYKEMISVAHTNNKLVIPSILLWALGEDRNKLDETLRSSTSSDKLISDIVKVVKENNLDGIDIDFENKLAQSKDVFSEFLIKLSNALHTDGNMLICTIEARTPLDSKYLNLTPEKLKEIEYANDLVQIGKACDNVRIMAYDQLGDDQQLNNSRGSTVNAYKPVADIDWVKKVLVVAMQDIPWKKIIVGVPTYGYKYEITRDSNNKIIAYDRIGSINYYYADLESKNKNITPQRDSGGELSYSYIDLISSPTSTTPVYKEYYVVYSDAKAIQDKINLAKLYKIGGVSIFKIDGNNDPMIWNNL